MQARVQLIRTAACLVDDEAADHLGVGAALESVGAGRAAVEGDAGRAGTGTGL